MSIWAFAVRRWQFTLVLFALLIALGVASFLNIPRSEDPTFPFPSATITLVWPGANAGDMERLIVKPLEDAVNTLENVKKIVSSAVDGLAVVHVEFYYGSDPEKKQDEVIREFNRIRTSLPPDIAQIDIRKDSPGLVNIVQMALVSDTAGWRELKEKAENLKDLFETVPGVRTSETWAFPQPEVRVAIDLERLARTGVSLDQVISTVQGQNQNIPGGAVDVGLRRYNLRTSGRARSKIRWWAPPPAASSKSRISRMSPGRPRSRRIPAVSTASVPCSSQPIKRTTPIFSKCGTVCMPSSPTSRKPCRPTSSWSAALTSRRMCRTV
jgi:multidrug efflux pump subunit AcrB